MKNIMNLAPQAMLKVDLAKQLQNNQKARPARSINSEKRSSMTDPVKENSKVEKTEHQKKEKEDDFDNVLSGHVNEQQQHTRKQATKGDSSVNDKLGDKKTTKKSLTDAKKFNLLMNADTKTKSLFKNKGAPKTPNITKGELQQEAPQKSPKPNLPQTQELLSLALNKKTKGKFSQKLPNIETMSLMNDKSIKSVVKKEGKFELDPNLFEQTGGEQKVDFKTLQNQGKNTQDNGQQLQKQLEQQQQQQQQTSTQNDKAKANADNFMEAQEQSLAKGNETSFKPAENRTESSKMNTQHFGFKGQNTQPGPTPKMVAKAIQNSSTGVNKNFAQATEMMDPKVKVQLDSHQANIRIATEKAGEVAVRVQMQQEGVTDIKLVGENAEIFNKKDELLAALQAEGLDLGQFNLAQDFEQQDSDNDEGEAFEKESDGTNIASTKVASSARVKNGATLHVQA
jgi:hypothetical protein